ncbi:MULTISPECIES: UbiA family prenyltransferase [unclassified Bradyrhizobium]|uniref:UbiA family prenyltransferase n=1 Tax=unclassified Bradyrhizobium TaxID=2631580 RepID=UPI0028EB07C5|nr:MULTISPECIES: UbiA family prenyltransferase [unclassified Bradyrhizobium]
MIYFRAMQPLHITAFFSVMHVTSAFAFFSCLNGTPRLPPIATWYAFPTTALIYVVFRIDDEIKDEDFDRVFNPLRPLVTGEAQYADIKVIALASIACLVAINVGREGVVNVFMVLVIFLVLSGRSFYFPQQIARSYWLTIVTGGHPLSLLGNYYFYAVYSSVAGVVTISPLVVAYACLLFLLPTAAWEIARKTRAPEEETERPSYSKRWGRRTAIIIPMMLIALCTTSFAFFGITFGASRTYVLGNVACGLIAIGIFGRFLLRPIPAHNCLRVTVEAYDIAARSLIIVEVAARTIGAVN